MELSGIYQIRNLLSSKIYVGSAVNFKKRLWYHEYDLRHNLHHSKYLQNSWNKHKDSNFEFSILEICSEGILLEREQYWLDFLKPYDSNLGYNIRAFAGSGKGGKHTEEAKLKMKEFGKSKPINPKAIRAMQLANMGRKNPKNAKRMSEYFSVSVVQLTLDGRFVKEWKSMTEATLSFNIKQNDSNIAACTRGKCRSARGFLWIKKKDYNPDKKYNYVNNRGKSNSIKVYQYSLDGEFIKEWESANKAAKFYNVNSQGIYNCVWGKNKCKTCKGYKWYRTKL